MLQIKIPAPGNESHDCSNRQRNPQDFSQCSCFDLNGLCRSGCCDGIRCLWHDDGLLANRAINLRANIIRVALNVLAACRTEKLEFRHNESLFTDYDTRAGDLFEENRPIFQLKKINIFCNLAGCWPHRGQENLNSAINSPV